MAMKHRLREPPASDGDKPRRVRLGRHGLMLRSISVAPAICTLLNGLCGFAAIHMASRSKLGQADLSQFGEIAIAAWLIFLAMVFDMLDGRLARWARKTSDFGAQLDSLCDAISFGVAPAMLMLQAVSRYISGDIDIFGHQSPVFGRIIFAIAILYVCCAILRLARFNVENAPDLLHHLHFKGLPSPGAAATVAAIVLLFDAIQSIHSGWRSSAWLELAVFITLPVATFAVALLMISNFRYSHLLNQFVVGRKPFSFLIKALIAIVVAVVFFQMAMALATIVYAASGPVGAIIRRARSAPTALPPTQDDGTTR
jgi:CDP-diacylglycerol--serine O-phosphatidyltransferase